MRRRARPRARELTILPSVFRTTSGQIVLSRLQNFLPLMASANELLANQDADDLDIENVGEEEAQYVEMVSHPRLHPAQPDTV